MAKAEKRSSIVREDPAVGSRAAGQPPAVEMASERSKKVKKEELQASTPKAWLVSEGDLADLSPPAAVLVPTHETGIAHDGSGQDRG